MRERNRKMLMKKSCGAPRAFLRQEATFCEIACRSTDSIHPFARFSRFHPSNSIDQRRKRKRERRKKKKKRKKRKKRNSKGRDERAKRAPIHHESNEYFIGKIRIFLRAIVTGRGEEAKENQLFIPNWSGKSRNYPGQIQA